MVGLYLRYLKGRSQSTGGVVADIVGSHKLINNAFLFLLLLLLLPHHLLFLILLLSPFLLSSIFSLYLSFFLFEVLFLFLSFSSSSYPPPPFPPRLQYLLFLLLLPPTDHIHPIMLIPTKEAQRIIRGEVNKLWMIRVISVIFLCAAHIK